MRSDKSGANAGTVACIGAADCGRILGSAAEGVLESPFE